MGKVIASPSLVLAFGIKGQLSSGGFFLQRELEEEDAL